MDKFSHNTKILMAVEDITVKQLAEKSNISVNTLSKVLSGHIKLNLEIAMKVSFYFNVPMEDILSKNIKVSFF